MSRANSPPRGLQPLGRERVDDVVALTAGRQQAGRGQRAKVLDDKGLGSREPALEPRRSPCVKPSAPTAAPSCGSY